MIILVDRDDPEVRIVLDGRFADDDAEMLMRTFPQLRRARMQETPEGQMALFGHNAEPGETDEATAPDYYEGEGRWK